MRSRGSEGRRSAVRRGYNRPAFWRPPAPHPPATSPDSHAPDSDANAWSRLLCSHESVDWFKRQSQPTDASAGQCCLHRSKRLSRHRHPRLGPQENRRVRAFVSLGALVDVGREILSTTSAVIAEHTHHPDSHGIHRQHAILFCCSRGGFAETNHHHQSRTNWGSRARVRLALHLHRQWTTTCLMRLSAAWACYVWPASKDSLPHRRCALEGAEATGTAPRGNEQCRRSRRSRCRPGRQGSGRGCSAYNRHSNRSNGGARGAEAATRWTSGDGSSGPFLEAAGNRDQGSG